jgi:hypothetical protein
VNFGAPNMFVTLWFELDYGTNPLLGTLMIWQVQLCMCIWKCYVFAGKHALKVWSHNKFKRANEESHSCSSARWNHSKGGRDQGVTTEHSRGQKREGQTSYEMTPYLKRKDDVATMMQLKG